MGSRSLQGCGPRVDVRDTVKDSGTSGAVELDGL
jgi:hypothetical protein